MERDPGRADRDRAGAVGGVPADGLLRRLDRRDLPPVLDHHRLGDGAVGAGRADPEPGADRDPAASDARRRGARRRLDRRFPASRSSVAARRAGSTAASTRDVERYRGAVGTVIDRKWLFLAIYAAIVALLVVLFLRLPTGFLPTEDQGVGAAPVHACRRAPPRRARSAVAERDRALLPDRRRRTTSAPSSPSPAAAAAAARRPERRPRLHRLRPLGRAARARRTPPTRSPQRATGALSRLRDAQFFALVPPPVRGLGQSSGFTMELQNTGGLSRDEFKARARPAAGDGAAPIRVLTARPAERPARHRRRCKSTSTSRSSARSASAQADVNATLVDRLGRALRQRLHRPRPGEARLCPGRRAVPRRPEDLGALVRAHGQRRDGAVLRPSRRSAGRPAPTQPVAVQRRRRPTRSRARPRPGTARARRWTAIERARRADCPASRSPGRACPIRSGCPSGQAPLLYAHLAAGRVPVPRRALRELVDPVRGAAGHPARPGRRGLRGDAARARERRLSPDRPAHDDGARRQERDPDGRVRRARREAGRARDRRGARGGAHPAAADPDDQLRLHLRRAAAGDRRPAPAPTAASRSAPR